MTAQMAYLIGMILGNGEVQRDNNQTTITIDIPFKKQKNESGQEVAIYIKAIVLDIRGIIEPLVGSELRISEMKNSIKVSFSKNNNDYTMIELMRYIGNGATHKTMEMNQEIFQMTLDEKKELLRGIADVTGHIRDSNHAWKGYEHRVYLEIPGNWQMVTDIANLLKDVDIPIHSIDFGHPNFRDKDCVDYDAGKQNAWKREHQIKIFANEFLPIGFNLIHKQRSLEYYSNELLKNMKNPNRTHKYYWERAVRGKAKKRHPAENDSSLPDSIRGRHFDHWQDLAKTLGYHE